MHIPFIIQKVNTFFRITHPIIFFYIIISFVFPFSGTYHIGYLYITDRRTELLDRVDRFPHFCHIQIPPCDLMEVTVNIHMAVSAVIPFCIGLQIHSQSLCPLFVKCPAVKVLYKTEFLFYMIFISLDNSCIIPDCSALIICNKKDQIVFRIVFNQVFYRKRCRNGIFLFRVLGDICRLYQPLSIYASHFETETFNLAPEFFNGNRQLSSRSERRDRIPHGASLHLFQITMQTVDLITALTHIYQRKRRLSHFHCHVCIPLIHKGTDNKYGNKKSNDPYNNL